MTDEPQLFPLDAYLMDSPELRARKEEARVLRTVVRENHIRRYCTPTAPEPWCAWYPDNDAPKLLPHRVPYDPDLCGYGETEREACGALEDIYDFFPGGAT